MIELEDVIDAYMDCRRHKSNTANAIRFEMDYERHCIELWHEIINRTYEPRRSICFVVKRPVRREVFAADFRDRVVHHLIARRIYGLLEKQFLPDSYSTQKGKGTLYGIERVEQFMRTCSENYTCDCYVMKIDIRSFFMSLPKQGLYDSIKAFLDDHYEGNDKDTLLWLIKKTIFNRPEKNCIRKSPRNAWAELPPNKSLFGTDGTRGLPIGNLTSQLLALLYLDPLDHLITGEWGFKYYGRYVDDMIFIHPSKQKLLEVREKIRDWLNDRGLVLHPKKMYLQHVSRGVNFTGAYIKKNGKYLSRRTVGNFFGRIYGFNRTFEQWKREGKSLQYADIAHVMSSMNSYLGLLCRYRSRRLLRKVHQRMSPDFFDYFCMSEDVTQQGMKSRLLMWPAYGWPRYEKPLLIFDTCSASGIK